MAETGTPALSALEERRRQRHYQNRLVAIRKACESWLEFERTILADEDYHLAIRRLVIRISQKVTVETNRLQSQARRQGDKEWMKRRYGWGQARSEVLSHDVVESVSRRFNQPYDDIWKHVSKYAGHSGWLSGVYARGEGGMLRDIMEDLKRDVAPPPVILRAAEPPPLVLTAAQINEATAKARTEFAKAEREFLGDDSLPSRTGEFGFVEDAKRESRRVNPSAARRKPRKNWRREL